MKALFCYYGRMTDHTKDIPGHPLYMLYFLNAIAKKFNIDKFDVYYYDENLYNYTDEDFKYYVCGKKRIELEHKLINKTLNTVNDVLDSEYDIVFLKYRFRNYSRLREGCLDRLHFEKIYKKCKDKCYIIDTDAMINEPYENIITLFLNSYDYESKNVIKMCPVLKEDFEFINNPKLKRLTYIGNEYFKEGLIDVFNGLQIPIFVQGKWNYHEKIFSIINRCDRYLGYMTLEDSLCSLQISKQVYATYDFLSPRIFESLLLGTIIFGKNSFMPKFSKFNTIEELNEKIKFLSEISYVDYTKYLKLEINELYTNIEERLNDNKS